ncbi:MAG: hypothetical protein WKF47_18790 [Geodermatophilaceae bacterium]
MSSHVFVDETKRRGYLLVASAVVPGDLDATRRMLRGLVLPGQRRAAYEGRERLAQTLDRYRDRRQRHHGDHLRRRPRATDTERERRAACLTALVVDAAARGDAMLVLEQDDTLVVSDRKLLYRATREAGCPDLRYEHRRAAVEQLLALPDAIAWCWAKGGDWRRRIQPIVTHVREV